MPDGPFRHGVASGDPTEDSVVIWTRVTPRDGEPIPVRWAIRAEADGRVAASGTVLATASTDWTVSVDVEGLAPGARYLYHFETGTDRSPDGRTQTLRGPHTDHVRFAQVSCAKFNAGYFNALSRVAERDDLDFVLHLGDYIYEAAQTPPASQTASADIGRPFDPLHECKTLDDYRRRYAQYRSDRDVQRMHAAWPMIATVDDHEFADGAWRDGATEHREDRDGPWADRRAAAFRARFEWLPIRPPDRNDPERVFRAIRLGGLAELFLVDTRTRRDEPIPPPGMNAPGRSAFGPEQREWLFEALGRSTATWRLFANPSVMARTWNDALPDAVKAALLKLKLIDADGTGPDHDQWDGYPAERAALLRELAADGKRNTVVLSGDVHVALAAELADDSGAPVAVEFVNSSLTSQNLDDKMGWQPRTRSTELEAAYLSGMPHIGYCDFDSHGYSIVDLTPDRLQFEWWAVDSILERTSGERRVAALSVVPGDPRLVSAMDTRLPR